MLDQLHAFFNFDFNFEEKTFENKFLKFENNVKNDFWYFLFYPLSLTMYIGVNIS